jgi:hypothetical protein
MSDGMHQTVGLRILSESGDKIDYSPDRDLVAKIWESSIFTGGQPEGGAVVVLLSIEDDRDQNRIQVDSRRGQSDLFTIERAIALLTEVRNALLLSRLIRAG